MNEGHFKGKSNTNCCVTEAGSLGERDEKRVMVSLAASSMAIPFDMYLKILKCYLS